jgi:hypothetical protein
VAPEVTEMRITQSPRHMAPPTKHSPSCCTRAITASVAPLRDAESLAPKSTIT